MTTRNTETRKTLTLTTRDGRSYSLRLSATEEAYWRPIWEREGHTLAG